MSCSAIPIVPTRMVTSTPERASPASPRGLVRPAAPVPVPDVASDAPRDAGAGAFLLALSPFAAGLLTGWLVDMGGALAGIVLVLGGRAPL